MGIPETEVHYQDDRHGEFVLEGNHETKIDPTLLLPREEWGSSLTLMVAHQHTLFEDRLLPKALSWFPNQVVYPVDILMKEMFSFGDLSSYVPLHDLFENVPRDLLETAGAFLRCGLDESLAAERLFIHRNTFIYRLKKFIDITNLDIRDYHNALLLELYFQTGSGRAS